MFKPETKLFCLPIWRDLKNPQQFPLLSSLPSSPPVGVQFLAFPSVLSLISSYYLVASLFKPYLSIWHDFSSSQKSLLSLYHQKISHICFCLFLWFLIFDISKQWIFWEQEFKIRVTLPDLTLLFLYRFGLHKFPPKLLSPKFTWRCLLKIRAVEREREEKKNHKGWSYEK